MTIYLYRISGNYYSIYVSIINQFNCLARFLTELSYDNHVYVYCTCTCIMICLNEKRSMFSSAYIVSLIIHHITARPINKYLVVLPKRQ